MMRGLLRRRKTTTYGLYFGSSASVENTPIRALYSSGVKHHALVTRAWFFQRVMTSTHSSPVS